MKTINVGVIGYGWAAAAHIAAINATRQGQVTAVYSSRPLDAAELSAKHASGGAGNRIKTYQNLSEMLADPSLHAVDITSYPSQHRDQALAAAKAASAATAIASASLRSLEASSACALLEATAEASMSR